MLSTAYVLKEQVLETIEQRHADERAFQIALSEWQGATAEPEHHPNWSQFYANVLRDALRKANARRKESLAAMTQADWRRIVHQELKADLWYAAPHSEEELTPDTIEARAPSIMRNGNGTAPKASAAVESGVV